MNLLTSKAIHYAVSRFGTPGMRAKAFDAKYASGEWAQCPDKPLARKIEKYSRNERVTVLGCGSCGLARELNPGSYSLLFGMDVSSEAIRQAESQSVPNTQFVVGDISRWSPAWHASVTVFPESIYYLSNHDRRELLWRLYRLQRHNDVMMATIADPERFSGLLTSIRRDFRIIEDGPIQEGSRRRLIVFR